MNERCITLLNNFKNTNYEKDYFLDTTNLSIDETVTNIDDIIDLSAVYLKIYFAFSKLRYETYIKQDLKISSCLKSAIENLPAFKETIKFIFDRCNGRISEVSEKTIDDAFDCIINNRKSSIYSNETLSHHEKERMILQIESSFYEIREYFKSSNLIINNMKI